GRRRHARQAVGRFGDLRRSGLLGARPQGRRPCRAVARAGTARSRQPRVLDDVPRIPSHAPEPGRHLPSRQDHGRRPKEPGSGTRMSATLLELRQLSVSFATDDGTVRAVDGIDLALERGRTLGLVGESGCGKSVTSLAVMGLLPPENSKVSGEVHFEGRDLLKVTPRELRDLRGARLAMIFQEPMTSLNPSFTIGNQIVEAIRRHQGLDATAAKARAIEVLRLVRIPSPEKRFDDYPHKLSGGMRQRAMIAMALACGPQLLIADEPTTALDVTIQAQIL